MCKRDGPWVWNAAIGFAPPLFFGIGAAWFRPAYVAALYAKGIARKAVIIGMASGFCTSLIWMILFFGKTAKVIGLSQLLFDKPSLVAGTACSKLMFVDPIVIALTLSAVVTVIARYLIKADLEKKHVDFCFNGIK